MVGIGAEIHDDLMDLGGVGLNIFFRTNVFADIDRAGDGGAQQLQGLLDDRPQLNGVAFSFCLTAERENLVYQIPCPFRGLARFR